MLTQALPVSLSHRNVELALLCELDIRMKLRDEASSAILDRVGVSGCTSSACRTPGQLPRPPSPDRFATHLSAARCLYRHPGRMFTFDQHGPHRTKHGFTCGAAPGCRLCGWVKGLLSAEEAGTMALQLQGRLVPSQSRKRVGLVPPPTPVPGPAPIPVGIVRNLMVGIPPSAWPTAKNGDDHHGSATRED